MENEVNRALVAKKKFNLLAFSIAVLCLLSLQTASAIDSTYYGSIDATTGATLRNELCDITRLGPQNMNYNKLWSAYYITDVYPEDSVDKAGMIWDMYSNVLFTPGEDQCGTYAYVGSCYNREHSLPKSWFDEKAPAVYDLGHVVPTDGKVNGQRNNFAFGECADGTRLSYGDHVGKGKLGASTFPGHTITSNVFEPDDEYKGDFARMYMYMRVRYKEMDMTYDHGSEMFNDEDVNFGMTYYAVDLLMKWHRQDPVSVKEILRNNGMDSVQHNRNPFIDYPILAEYLWGTRLYWQFLLADAMPSFDPEFIPGESDGSRPGTVPPVPPTPSVMVGVTWSVNGEALYVDSIAKDSLIAALPAEPVSCSLISTEFIGWTNEPIPTSQVDPPAVLYMMPADFPPVVADITYYAVFAQPVDDAYIRNITNCQSEEAIENTPISTKYEKILRDGQLLILIDNRLFNLQGQRVK